jgi:hypothetical protein
MSTDDWILDVLADLGEFARTNRLDALALELTRVRRFAAAELSSQRIAVSVEGCRNAESARAGVGHVSERQGA